MSMTLIGIDELTAVSPVDGRYRAASLPLAEHFSEFALIRNRIVVEVEYLIALSGVKGLALRRFTPKEKALLRSIPTGLSLEDARIVKAIERKGYKDIPATNHDVKAIEYFIKLKLEDTSLKNVLEWVHFALTSEDVNSVAQALSLRGALEQVQLPAIERVRACIVSLARTHGKTAMLARTHGQPASPTTFGKEMAVFARRIEWQVKSLRKNPILVKWGGATGNYNAHTVAAPRVNWPKFASALIAMLNKGHDIKLEVNDTTTQIEPHDTYAELFDNMRRINTILLDLSQDMWRYISDDWVVQKPKAGEVGSSAMPHKVNPIDWENAEGNLGVANALFEHFSRKLPVSRLQRDLSDSTVSRAFGTAFAHTLIALSSLEKGFGKISPNRTAMLEAVLAHPEVLSEAIQTVLRAEGAETPYERLKELTRGKKVALKDLRAFIATLDISSAAKKRLKMLHPDTYTGIAAKLAK